MNGAALVHRRGREQQAILHDRVPGERDVALLGENETGIADRTAAAAGMEDRRDLVAARSGELVDVGAVARAQDEVVARGKLGLPLRRDDRTGIVDLGPHHQNETAALGDRCRRVGRDQRALLHHDLAAGAGETRQIGPVGLRRIDAIGQELLVGDPGRRGDQRADIDLARAAKDDAALVDDQDLAQRIDVAEDLARTEIADDAVERGPGAGLLIEVDRGLRTDVEGLPVQDRLRRGLLDADDRLTPVRTLGRRVGAGPACRHVRHQPAHRQTVRNLAQHALRRRTRCILQALHGLERLCRPYHRLLRGLGDLRRLLRVRDRR